MEMEKDFASKGVAGAGLGLGIAGTALGVLNGGGLGNWLGGGWNAGWRGGGCCDAVGHYELTQESRISELQAGIALRDANVYNDQKLLEVYKYFDGKLEGIHAQLAQQAVVNAQITANLGCMQRNLDVLNGLTKTVIPVDSICPEVMQRYNSWVAPTATAPTT